jgi:hypothetical protein
MDRRLTARMEATTTTLAVPTAMMDVQAVTAEAVTGAT